MIGNKGGGRKAGRLTNAEEQFRLRTISKAWKLIDSQLENPDLDIKFRLDLAAKIAVKSIPTELSGDLGVAVTAMGEIKKTVGDVVTTLEFKIGGNANPPQDPEHTGEAPAGDNEI